MSNCVSIYLCIYHSIYHCIYQSISASINLTATEMGADIVLAYYFKHEKSFPRPLKLGKTNQIAYLALSGVSIELAYFSFSVGTILSLFRCHQCDRLGNFWKVLSTKFLTKVAQIFCDFCGYFEEEDMFCKTTVDTYWTTFRKIGLLFVLTSGHTVCNVYACIRPSYSIFFVSSFPDSQKLILLSFMVDNRSTNCTTTTFISLNVLCQVPLHRVLEHSRSVIFTILRRRSVRPIHDLLSSPCSWFSVTRLGVLLDFGQLFKDLGNN